MSLSSELTQHVRLERPSSISDGYGGSEISWVELATVFADVKPVFGAVHQREMGAQQQANAGYRVVIRTRTDITGAMRIIWKTRVLLIHSLHESAETLNILCYEENV